MATFNKQMSIQPHRQMTTFNPQAPLPVHGEVGMCSSAPPCKFAAPGFAAMGPPFSYFYRLKPERYTKAFTSSGRLVGVNQEVPYPFENKLYHHVPFNRNVDWSQTEVFSCELESKSCMAELIKQRTKKAGSEAKEPGVAGVEPAEYFTAENDEGYNQWVTRQLQEKAAPQKVPQDIKNLPGHYGPSLLETTNETYGQYIDLLPKFPAVYPQKEKLAPAPLNVLVSFHPTNMSDHPPIPNHPFAVDPREMITGDSCYARGMNGLVFYPEVPGRQHRTAYTFSNSHRGLGPSAGERGPGLTFPMYSVTGLELNRPVPQRVDVVAGARGRERFRLRVPPRTVPYVYKRYMSYTAPPSLDPEAEANPARVARKQICAPCDPKACSLTRTNPCSLDYINPQLLPIPVEVRKHPYC